MLFTQFISRFIAIVTLSALILCPLPADAEVVSQPDQSVQTQLTVARSEEIPLLACAMCGCNELCAVAGSQDTSNKHADPSLLTDSLWGNLILQMAYERDKDLEKLAKKLNIVNLGTMGAFFGIASGTLAQGISAMYVLNPPDGVPDSYAPLYVGTALSGATMITFLTRAYFEHRYQKKIHTKQLAIKERVEEILHHLEYSDAKCPEAKEELATLIGPRASGEFLQLWQSSHQQLATMPDRQISMLPKKEAETPPVGVP